MWAKTLKVADTVVLAPSESVTVTVNDWVPIVVNWPARAGQPKVVAGGRVEYPYVKGATPPIGFA
jgi:hypothetical protein